jgi:rfaE bifunctional protein kinase chain/domain
MNSTDRHRLRSVIEKLSGVKALVVGDLMLDRYWWGDVTRISPEAPVPVVRLRKDTYAVGGAANVAANMAGLGAVVYLAGTIGDDREGEKFVQILESLSLSTRYLVRSGMRPTTVKTRVIAHNQQIVRVDQEDTTELSAADEEKLWANVLDVIDEVDTIVISDYAKGILSEGLTRRLIATAKSHNKPVLVDPKGKDYTKYSGASLLTPNRREAADACHLESETQDLVDIAGKSLLDDLELEAVLITQSEDGMTLFQKDGGADHLSASAVEIYDVTGAGDTVIACMGAALGARADYLEAAKIANLGAGLVIRHIGTSFVTAGEILDGLMDNIENSSGETAGS